MTDSAFHLRADDRIDRPVVALFAAYARPHVRVLIPAIVASLAFPLVALVPVYLLHTAIDRVLLAEEPFVFLGGPPPIVSDPLLGHLLMIAGLMIAATTLAAVLSVVSTLGWGRFAQEVQHQLRVDAFEAVQRRGVAFVEARQTGQLMSVLNDDVAECNRLLERFLKDLLETGARCLGIGLVLIVLHWQLALIVLLVLPPMLFVARWFVRRIRPLYGELRERVGVLNARLENALNGIHVVKATAGDEYEINRIQRSSRRVYEAQWRVIAARAAFFPTISTMNWSSFAVILVLGGHWYLAGPPFVFTQELTIGILVAFLLYNQQLATPLMQASHLVDVYYEARAAVARILWLFEYPSPDRHAEQPDDPAVIEGSIDIEDLRFSYPHAATPTIDDLTLHMKAGWTVGVVGPTGSGKTTFLTMLLRFYTPDAGHIRLDGRDLREIDPRALRQAVGYVPQEPYLFTGTIRENVCYPAREVTDAAIEDALRTAQAWSFVSDLPGGMEAEIGQGGITLSGGQRQRIAIARALLGDPAILLLDEATSHLDMETEAALHRALANAHGHRTTIAVAHRLTSVRHADLIVVFEDGRIAETGRHRDLVEDGGSYARLWDATNRPDSAGQNTPKL